ncbi:N-acetylmannosamine kinase [Oceaniovalibus guishaninsula JLT2003]|uniref:N-acetylmannosamine kinase n=1 Tax=Oceaniovalibus guishaninsula JLT2003 TaxID=1231392 RepID=K2H897_9RHOB|nr:ROK family protein [Oceaniovalibus guishaninsula]EKE43838.1 N-acetylmannosamine kinase [Oceaniovalibus guishaninsula JLT2003]
MELADLGGFAVDLGGTKIAAARIDSGRVVERLLAATDGMAGPEAQMDAMAGLLTRLGHTAGAPLGVGVAGRIDGAGRWCAVNRDTLSAIDGFALQDALRDRLGAATCCNDAAAAALAEARFGAGRDARNFAYLTVSTGIGGGIVLGGRLIESENGLAGHAGFVTSRHAEGPCGSGRRDTVESVAGGRGIAAAAAARGHPGQDARAVIEAAKSGAAWAEDIVATSARAVASLIGDLAAILGLDGVAVGGSIGLAQGYLDRVRASLADEPPLFRPALQAAALGHDGPLLGALALHFAKVSR